MLKRIIWVILIAIGALAIWYIAADRETITAEDFRADSDYEVATLTHGATAYRIYGAAAAQPLVIVHGGTFGSLAYQAYVPPLVAAGYRVVLYDQYGRGFSDRPDVPLSIDLMRVQLLELLDYLQIDRARMFGVSLGGAILARFAAEHPDRVVALAYQVPVIAGADVDSALTFARLPIIGALLSRLYLMPVIIERGESFGAQTESQRRVLAHFRDQFKVKGTERMMRNMVTGDMLSNRLGDHQRVGASGIAAQFAYATDDAEINPKQVEAAINHYKMPQVHRYLGGHFFSRGRDAELSRKLVAFFADKN